MSIAVVGESTAAGYGVDSHDLAFAGCLARELAVRSGRRVRWAVVGQDGATARRIRHRLVPQLGRDLDLAVLLAGANDVLSRRSPRQWGDDLTAIVDDLADRARKVVVTGIPPFELFPALPRTLARYLAEGAATLNAVSRQVCGDHPRATWIGASDGLDIGPEFFGPDRFHPSTVGYERWARDVARQV
jgi:lysophospholipase L1-like esterase